MQRQSSDEPVYQFLNKKRSKGKPYKVYMIAAAHKFLHIYYARVKEDYCEGSLLDDYLHDMEIMQKFAGWNKLTIADTIFKGCKLKEESRFTTIHNNIDLKYNILRKEAVSAQKDEILLIHINMRNG